MRKLLNELPMIGFGAGIAVAGASFAMIGIYGVKKNFYMSALVMGSGAWAAHFGTQVAIGAVERVRGLQ